MNEYICNCLDGDLPDHDHDEPVITPVVVIAPEFFDHMEHLLDAERWDGPAPEIPVFDGGPRSPWVRRAQENDLPTFDRHNGAYAYR